MEQVAVVGVWGGALQVAKVWRQYFFPGLVDVAADVAGVGFARSLGVGQYWQWENFLALAVPIEEFSGVVAPGKRA